MLDEVPKPDEEELPEDFFALPEPPAAPRRDEIFDPNPFNPPPELKLLMPIVEVPPNLESF